MSKNKRPFDPKKIVGERYGKLEVVRFDHDEIIQRKHAKQRIHYVLFKCDCGNSKVIAYHTVATGSKGAVRSCGCKYYDRMKESHVYPNRINKSGLYMVYYNMIRRCTNPDDKDFHKYGARGIYVCDEWCKPNIVQGYINFYNWAMANGYIEYDQNVKRKHRVSIDRIDNDGPYAPWNCRWTTYIVQANNRRSNVHIEDLDGENLTWSEFDRKHNLPLNFTKRKMRKYKGHRWPISAIIYAAYNPELGIHRMTRTGTFVDKDGFQILIPNLEILRRMYK